MREFNLLEEYPKLDQPRYVASNLRTLKERIVANQRDEIFRRTQKFLVTEDINMMGVGKR